MEKLPSQHPVTRFVHWLRERLEAILNHPVTQFILRFSEAIIGLGELNETLAKLEGKVRRKVNQFGDALANKINRFQRLIFCVLVNVIVLAYFAGKSNAITIEEWWLTFSQHEGLFIKFLVATFIALFITEVFWVFKKVFRLVLTLLFLFGLYKLFCWARPKVIAWFNTQNSTELPE
ncbi:MAG: hypothetical protein ACI9Z3_000847 [Roseivirga sp.]|jgi:hypothetical protein